MTHVTYRLTAKNRDQLQNPTLGNRVWATFTFFIPREMCETVTVVRVALAPLAADAADNDDDYDEQNDCYDHKHPPPVR